MLTNGYSAVRYFAYDVSANAYEATFQLLQLSGNADLVVSKGAPLPVLNSENYGSFNTGHGGRKHLCVDEFRAGAAVGRALVFGGGEPGRGPHHV